MPVIEFNHLELAWAAGFFDGEGCTTGKQWPSMIVVQADRRPLDRFQAALGFGVVKERSLSENRFGTKPMWQWAVSDFEHIQAAICMLWPYLSEPKREQAHRVILGCREKRAETCPSGKRHPGQKLTPATAENIKKRLGCGESGHSIARLHGVSQQLVSDIKRGRRWV